MCFPNREMLYILGFRAPGKANLSKHWVHTALDLVPTFRAGCFSKSTVAAFASFSDSETLGTISEVSKWFFLVALSSVIVLCWHG